MKNILVPIDFSPVSKNAFKYAIDFAAQYHSKITLFHAYTPAMIEPYMAVYMQQALQDQQEELAIEYFSEIEHEIPAELRELIQIDFRISLGPAVEEIISLSEEIQADIIIMGMRGGNILTRKILGSTTTDLLQRSECPVLVVPQGKRYTKFQHIAYATNYDEDDLKVIDHLLDFAGNYNATVHCIHIKQDESVEDLYRSAILKKAYQYDLSGDKLAFDTIEYNDIAQGINYYTRENDIDLLVMLTHKKSILGNLLSKSFTRKVSQITQIPLLVFQKNMVYDEQEEQVS